MKSKDAQAIKLISLVREAEKMVTELKHLIGQSTAGNSLNASSQHKVKKSEKNESCNIQATVHI